MDIPNTIAVVVFTPLFLWFIRAICRGLYRLIPAGRTRDALFKERGYNARPTVESLRSGLK